MASALGRANAEYSRWVHIQRRQNGQLWQGQYRPCIIEHRLGRPVRPQRWGRKPKAYRPAIACAAASMEQNCPADAAIAGRCNALNSAMECPSRFTPIYPGGQKVNADTKFPQESPNANH